MMQLYAGLEKQALLNKNGLKQSRYIFWRQPAVAGAIDGGIIISCQSILTF